MMKTIVFYNALWPNLDWDLNLSVCAEAQIPFRDIGLWLNNTCKGQNVIKTIVFIMVSGPSIFGFEFLGCV